MTLPGSGAISTSRAGAAVASVWGGDAIAINPAGLAIGKGTQITISSALIDYSLSFQRRGVYEATGREDGGARQCTKLHVAGERTAPARGVSIGCETHYR